jgi:hypothetical protein
MNDVEDVAGGSEEISRDTHNHGIIIGDVSVGGLVQFADYVAVR